jgi:hypothetical protein
MTRPATLPKATRALVESVAAEQWSRCGPSNIALPDRYLVGVRGYRRDTMGKSGVNDFGIWDDAMFYVAPGAFLVENANTDPSRVGWNAVAGKPMAVLQPGCWPFRRGPHKGKTPAYRQMTLPEARKYDVPNGGRFAVTRTYAVGDPRNYQEAGYYAINIHPGGINGTSSEGCQTIPTDRSQKFLQAVWDDTLNAKLPYFWYLLVEGLII